MNNKGEASVWVMSAYLAILAFCSFLVLLFDWVSNGHQLSILGIIGSMLVAVIVTILFYLYCTRPEKAEAGQPYGMPPQIPKVEKEAEAVEAYLRRLRRMRGEAEPDCLNSVLVALAVVAILVFFLAPLCRADDIDFAVWETTGELSGRTLLTADEYQRVRLITVATAQLVQAMQQSHPEAQDMRSKRIIIQTSLTRLTAELQTITAQHIQTVLSAMPLYPSGLNRQPACVPAHSKGR